MSSNENIRTSSPAEELKCLARSPSSISFNIAVPYRLECCLSDNQPSMLLDAVVGERSCLRVLKRPSAPYVKLKAEHFPGCGWPCALIMRHLATFRQMCAIKGEVKIPSGAGPVRTVVDGGVKDEHSDRQSGTDHCIIAL